MTNAKQSQEYPAELAEVVCSRAVVISFATHTSYRSELARLQQKQSLQ